MMHAVPAYYDINDTEVCRPRSRYLRGSSRARMSIASLLLLQDIRQLSRVRRSPVSNRTHLCHGPSTRDIPTGPIAGPNRGPNIMLDIALPLFSTGYRSATVPLEMVIAP